MKINDTKKQDAQVHRLAIGVFTLFISVIASQLFALPIEAKELETKAILAEESNEKFSEYPPEIAEILKQQVWELPEIILAEPSSEYNPMHFLEYWDASSNPEYAFTGRAELEVIDQTVYMLDIDGGKLKAFTPDGTPIWNAPLHSDISQYLDITSDGTSLYVSSAAYNGVKIEVYNLEGNFLRSWGQMGDGQEELSYPSGIDYNPRDTNLYIADSTNNRVQVFSTNGEYVKTIGEQGPGQLQFPYRVLVKDNKVYIIDSELQVLSTDGEYMTTLNVVAPRQMAENPADSTLLVHGYNSDVVQFNKSDELQGVLIEGGNEPDLVSYFDGAYFSNNQIYVLDTNHKQVKVFSHDARPQMYNNVTELALLNGQTLQSWYKQAMGAAVPNNANYDWFSGWKTAAIDNNLFLLLGTDKPNAQNGAALVRSQLTANNTLQPTLVSVQNRQNEQGQNLHYMEDDGVLDMEIFDSSNILIPGTDPGYLDNWSGGNAYTYSLASNILTKIRCKTVNPQQGDCGTDNHVFPGAVHSMAATVAGNNLYIGTSNVNNSSVYRSIDGGAHWGKVSDLLGVNRVYDLNSVITTNVDGSTQVTLFAMVSTPDGSKILYSTGSPESVGASWSNLGEQYYPNTSALGTTNGNAYYFSNGGTLYIATVNETGSIAVSTKQLPMFEITKQGEYQYNSMIVAKEKIYVISGGKYIYKGDLNGENWRRVASLRAYTGIQSLSYWAAQDSLVTVSRGEDAKVLLIPLTNDSK